MPWWGWFISALMVLGLMYLGVRAVWGTLQLIWRLKWLIIALAVIVFVVWACASVFGN
jgi:hypothetical protein